MKKSKLKHELNKIEEKLIEYFNDVSIGNKNGYETEYKVLKPLDKDTRLNYRFTVEGYTGVSINYIKVYILQNKYSLSMIHYTLLKLLSEKNIRTLYCSNIDKVVFENKDNKHCTRTIEDLTLKYKSRFKRGIRYHNIYRDYISINNYLNNNK